jgi:hypothetical protein
MYSYEPANMTSAYGIPMFFWIKDPNGVVVCPIEDEGHAVVLVDHLNKKA